VTTIWLPRELVELVDNLRKARHDPRRSDTVRFLILRSLAEMRLLPGETVRALGLKEINEDE